MIQKLDLEKKLPYESNDIEILLNLKMIKLLRLRQIYAFLLSYIMAKWSMISIFQRGGFDNSGVKKRKKDKKRSRKADDFSIGNIRIANTKQIKTIKQVCIDIMVSKNNMMRKRKSRIKIKRKGNLTKLDLIFTVELLELS